MVEVWDHQTGTLRRDLQYQDEGSFMMHEKAVIAVAFNKESELLATGSQDGQIKVWRIATGQCARRYEKAHSEGITCITWAKDSSQLLTGSFDFTARVHGIKSGKTLKEFRGHKSYVNSAVYTKDNARIVTASSDARPIEADLFFATVGKPDACCIFVIWELQCFLSVPVLRTAMSSCTMPKPRKSSIRLRHLRLHIAAPSWTTL